MFVLYNYAPSFLLINLFDMSYVFFNFQRNLYQCSKIGERGGWSSNCKVKKLPQGQVQIINLNNGQGCKHVDPPCFVGSIKARVLNTRIEKKNIVCISHVLSQFCFLLLLPPSIQNTDSLFRALALRHNLQLYWDHQINYIALLFNQADSCATQCVHVYPPHHNKSEIFLMVQQTYQNISIISTNC